MVITEYLNDKMSISPKSRKIATSTVPILFDSHKIRHKGRKTTPNKTPYQESGFKVSDMVNESIFKHNKKRTKQRKYIG